MSTFDLACSLECGEHFVEDVNGYQMYFVVSMDPTVFEQDGCTKVQWEVVGGGNSSPTNFLITKGLEHYGPKIYKE